MHKHHAIPMNDIFLVWHQYKYTNRKRTSDWASHRECNIMHLPIVYALPTAIRTIRQIRLWPGIETSHKQNRCDSKSIYPLICGFCTFYTKRKPFPMKNNSHTNCSIAINVFSIHMCVYEYLCILTPFILCVFFPAQSLLLSVLSLTWSSYSWPFAIKLNKYLHLHSHISVLLLL